MGFFLHIPFPSWDIIRIFPWCDEILQVNYGGMGGGAGFIMTLTAVNFIHFFELHYVKNIYERRKSLIRSSFYVADICWPLQKCVCVCASRSHSSLSLMTIPSLLGRLRDTRSRIHICIGQWSYVSNLLKFAQFWIYFFQPTEAKGCY